LGVLSERQLKVRDRQSHIGVTIQVEGLMDRLALVSSGCPQEDFVAHAFEPDELERLASAGNHDLLIGHDCVIDIPKWKRMRIHVEHLPVFVSIRSAIPTLSIEILSTVLSGRATDWRDVGGHPAPVGVVRHAGELQRRSSERALLAAGLPSTIPNATYVSYEALQRAGQAAGTLVLGIRALDAPGLRRVSVAGLNVEDATYPLRIAVSAYVRENSLNSWEAFDRFCVLANARNPLRSQGPSVLSGSFRPRVSVLKVANAR
jgi:hypothetical protein